MVAITLGVVKKRAGESRSNAGGRLIPLCPWWRLPRSIQSREFKPEGEETTNLVEKGKDGDDGY